MLVSNNNLLNILLPSENKLLKDVLKDADSKTLNNIKNGSSSVQDIIKDLFAQMKSGDKSNSNIENLLKNSSVFKDFGNFSTSLKELSNNINNQNLDKYKPILDNFLKDISNLDYNSLKSSLNNSGIFLEAKTLDSINLKTNLPKNLENILNELKNILKEIDSPQNKNIEQLIDKILQNNQKSGFNNSSLTLQNNSDLKSLLNQIQNLPKNLPDNQLNNLMQLTNSLKNISNEAQLIESKISNNLQNENFSQIKNTLISSTIDILNQLKSEILLKDNIPNSSNLLQQIDKLLQNTNLFDGKNNIDIKSVLTQLVNLNEIQTRANNNTNISSLVENLKNHIDKINQLEENLLNNKSITINKTLLTQDIQQTLQLMKNEISTMTNIDNKAINQIIDKILNLQNIFSKIDLPSNNIFEQSNNINTFKSNFASNINELLLSLKESISNFSSDSKNLNFQNNIFNKIDKLENIVNNFLQNSNIEKHQSQGNLQNDLKTVLLQIQDELTKNNASSNDDTLKNIDKMITQIEYHQLLSIASNSNNVYLPFIWDMMDEGTMSMKKINEEKFYCEINLSLKEFGKTQLLLALYDKNKLDLTIYASQEKFKNILRENSTKLKQALNSVKLIPVNIKIIDLNDEKNKIKQEQKQVNAYTINDDLGFGVNIKV